MCIGDAGVGAAAPLVPPFVHMLKVGSMQRYHAAPLSPAQMVSWEAPLAVVHVVPGEVCISDNQFSGYTPPHIGVCLGIARTVGQACMWAQQGKQAPDSFMGMPFRSAASINAGESGECAEGGLRAALDAGDKGGRQCEARRHRRRALLDIAAQLCNFLSLCCNLVQDLAQG